MVEVLALMHRSLYIPYPGGTRKRIMLVFSFKFGDMYTVKVTIKYMQKVGRQYKKNKGILK